MNRLLLIANLALTLAWAIVMLVGLWLRKQPYRCAGCGATTATRSEDWRFTDAAWCPKCAWLA